MRRIYITAIALALFSDFFFPIPSGATSPKTYNFQAEGWSDNWFSLYVNGKKVGEDPVPITTVRSFNSTKIKFSASYPFTLGVVVKDYVENASGLEYIGLSNQQIGDGGFSLQVRDIASNKIIATTNNSWKTLVINKAPLDPTCVTSKSPLQDCKYSNITVPKNWNSVGFNDSKWNPATEFTSEQVGVKDGYFDISWSSTAKLIWSKDLKLDNTILMRAKVIGPIDSQSSKSLTVTSTSISGSGVLDKSTTCDGAGISPQVSWDGSPTATNSFFVTMDTIPGPARPGDVITSDHSYFNVYDIPSHVHSIESGKFSSGVVGMNFKNNKPGYEPPCSQGPGAKVYTITVYALSSNLKLSPNIATQSSLLSAIQGKVLAEGSVTGSYSRA
jgi:phosphatidylethanolamine-binding protein (PEBP) family uncharacterized protein